MSGEAQRLTEVIQSVTDLWPERLDEVHDIPQIVNAILADGWAQVRYEEVRRQAWRLAQALWEEPDSRLTLEQIVDAAILALSPEGGGG